MGAFEEETTARLEWVERLGEGAAVLEWMVILGREGVTVLEMKRIGDLIRLSAFVIVNLFLIISFFW